MEEEPVIEIYRNYVSGTLFLVVYNVPDRVGLTKDGLIFRHGDLIIPQPTRIRNGIIEREGVTVEEYVKKVEKFYGLKVDSISAIVEINLSFGISELPFDEAGSIISANSIRVYLPGKRI